MAAAAAASSYFTLTARAIKMVMNVIIKDELKKNKNINYYKRII